ncbi:hypothetical protein DC498_11590 [Terrimonas sp.]|uniref:hypothetical protein n=1 Tax=Terrimonas sp. TaxID=1914338 RepID=UPI000D5112C0|nr:hypothetical protein [Terrimonas sp.]PVD52025.1 hypothetical protein DC498_11590 [Terrimonas sp.]
MKQFFYLTNNEFYSGIYQSQVIDVIEFLKKQYQVNIRLIAFIPLKIYFREKAIIKKFSKDAIVLPSMPKQSNGKMWKYNRYLLYVICIIYRCKGIIARNPIATNLALYAKKNRLIQVVCYDGRGAVAAESKEYNIYPPEVANIIEQLEQKSILEATYRICITNNLLKYWKEKYKYEGNNHVIIPGTLGYSFVNFNLEENEISKIRNELGYSTNDILLVYAGSVEGWQSFDLLYGFLDQQIRVDDRIKILFLSKADRNIQKIADAFPDKVKRLWLNPSEVKNVMSAADYGLIIRENSTTNVVALPTKFPEYLACGLNIIVSNAVEEVYRFVELHNCGILWNGDREISFMPSTFENRQKNRKLALTYYNKYSEEITSRYADFLKKLDLL